MMTAREFQFEGDLIKPKTIEYRVRWNLLRYRVTPTNEHGHFSSDARVTITKEKGMSGTFGSIELLGSELPKFIKELQTLVEFMKNDGLLTEEDQDEQEEDSARGD